MGYACSGIILSQSLFELVSVSSALSRGVFLHLRDDEEQPWIGWQFDVEKPLSVAAIRSTVYRDGNRFDLIKNNKWCITGVIAGQ
jgi:hypothetical protein